MYRTWKTARWIVPGAVMYAVGGCVSNQRMLDFVRVEFARLTADTIGQLFTLFVQATT